MKTKRCTVILHVPKYWRHMSRQNIMLISVRSGMLQVEKINS
jgi:hypothetical protein